MQDAPADSVEIPDVPNRPESPGARIVTTKVDGKVIRALVRYDEAGRLKVLRSGVRTWKRAKIIQRQLRKERR